MELRKLKRSRIANVVALIVAAVTIVAAWFISPSGIWSGAIVVLLAVVFTIPVPKAMEKHQDERFTHILNIAALNGFVFLLLALPWTGALIALDFLILDAPAAVLSLWFFSIAVMYASGVYYFRK